MNRLALLLGASLCLYHSTTLAQFVPLTELPAVPDAIPSETTVGELHPIDNSQYTLQTESSPEGGSDTVANLLKHLEPSVDTRLPETADQAAARINQLINEQRYDYALKEIAERRKNTDAIAHPGVDVQLLFLEARALAAMGNTSQSLEIYRKMTFNYPELPEPWNNMAVLQLQASSLDEALNSLQSALAIRPNYAIANRNIGLIYTYLAKRSFEKAASQGLKSARSQAQRLQQFLENRP